MELAVAEAEQREAREELGALEVEDEGHQLVLARLLAELGVDEEAREQHREEERAHRAVVEGQRGEDQQREARGVDELAVDRLVVRQVRVEQQRAQPEEAARHAKPPVRQQRADVAVQVAPLQRLRAPAELDLDDTARRQREHQVERLSRAERALRPEVGVGAADVVPGAEAAAEVVQLELQGARLEGRERLAAELKGLVPLGQQRRARGVALPPLVGPQLQPRVQPLGGREREALCTQQPHAQRPRGVAPLRVVLAARRRRRCRRLRR